MGHWRWDCRRAWRPVFFTAMTVLGVLCTEGLAQAGELNQTVIRELLQASGWEPIGNDVSVGLSMYEKPLKSVGLSAYMGVRDLPDDVDPDRLWAVIIDIDQHVQVGDKLVESKSFGGHAGGPDSYQVLRAPRLLAGAQRYWFVHSHIELDVEGTPGRNRRCWSNIPPGAAAAERARVQARYPDATPITLTHGCWEVLPAAPGAPARLRYLTVSDPGGALARTAVGMLTTRTLPENIANFVDRARR